MKEDVGPLPAEVPRKRRQLEALADLHIALWLADPALPAGDRKRLEAIKAARKAKVPDMPVGLVVGPEGVTSAQLAAIPVLLAGATEIHHPGVSSRLHSACRAVAPVTVHRDDLREVVRAARRVVAAPASGAPPATFEMMRYAKHRNLPLTVVRPDGSTDQGDTA